MKKLINISNITLTILLYIILLFVIVLIFSSKLTGEDTNLFGYQLKSVLSGSMEPNIKTGSIIAINSDIDKEKLREGDVIAFSEDGSVITHRIVEILKEEQYITKGDANNANDLNPVPAESIIGKYSGFTVPFVGYILSFTPSNYGIILFFIIPGVILVIHSFVLFWRVIQYVGQSEKNNEG